MPEKESKPHQIAYTTLLCYYLHPLKRLNSFLVKLKLQNCKSCQRTARYMEELRPFFSPFPSHRAPRGFFFFLPSLPATQRGLCGGERCGATSSLWAFIYHCCRYYLCNLFIIRGCRCITRANASMQISARKFAVLRFEGYMLCCLQSEIPFFIHNVWTQCRHANEVSLSKKSFVGFHMARDEDCYVRCPRAPTDSYQPALIMPNYS